MWHNSPTQQTPTRKWRTKMEKKPVDVGGVYPSVRHELKGTCLLLKVLKHSRVGWMCTNCQQIIIGTSSTSIGIHKFGVQWRRKPYSVRNSPIVIKQGCEAALGLGPSLARQLCSACSLPACSALQWSAPLCSREASSVCQQFWVEMECAFPKPEGT